MTAVVERCGVKRGKHPGSRVCRSTEIELYYVKSTTPATDGPKVPVCGRCWADYCTEPAIAFRERLDARLAVG